MAAPFKSDAAFGLWGEEGECFPHVLHGIGVLQLPAQHHVAAEDGLGGMVFNLPGKRAFFFLAAANQDCQ